MTRTIRGRMRSGGHGYLCREAERVMREHGVRFNEQGRSVADKLEILRDHLDRPIHACCCS